MEHRKSEQKILFNKLQRIKTPQKIIECIQHGLTKWESLNQESITMSAPTYGSVRPLDIALTQAFRDQTKHIGWEHFLKGRISIHWCKAFHIGSPKSQEDATSWGAELITHLLMYSSSLWKFRNGILHGHNAAESRLKEQEKIHLAISTAYSAYEQDKFVISRSLSSLFEKPIEYLLKADLDQQQCWLRTYEEGVDTQREFRHRQAEAAKNFFLPKKSTPTNRALAHNFTFPFTLSQNTSVPSVSNDLSTTYSSEILSITSMDTYQDNQSSYELSVLASDEISQSSHSTVNSHTPPSQQGGKDRGYRPCLTFSGNPSQHR